MTLITRNRRVALIALVVVMAEVFGFSSLTVYPTFARDVLDSDAAGLGALGTARYIGSIAVLLFLARVGLAGSRGGRLILLAVSALGLGLTAFALSTSFALSLAVLALVGAGMAGVDTLSQSLLQRNVDDAERGSAAGIWFFAIGFGPVGLVGLGAAANRSAPRRHSPSVAPSSLCSRSHCPASGRSTSSCDATARLRSD